MSDICLADDCDRPVIARGLCTKHYQRWRKQNHDNLNPSLRGVPSIDRLLSQCVEVEGCWLYTGVLDHKGYSRIRHNGRKAFGHRIAWEFFIGPFPEGLTFDHLCRRKNCVNPWHGDPVPSVTNSFRAPNHIARLNAEKTHCPQGHPLSGDNLRFASRGYGRVCRTCRAASCAAYRQRKAESA